MASDDKTKSASVPVYRIRGWEEHYENKASRVVNRPTWVAQPIAITHEYRRLMRWPGGMGPAYYGCFRALVGVAMSSSRTASERLGFLTLDGSPKSQPLTIADMASAIDMPEKIVEETLAACSSQAVGWIEVDASWTMDGPRMDHAGTMDGPVDPLGKGLEGTGGEGRGDTHTHTARAMPADGWDLATVKAWAEHETVGMPAKLLAEYWDQRAARGWVDGAGLPVARTVEALCADMRKWKVKAPSRNQGGRNGGNAGSSADSRRDSERSREYAEVDAPRIIKPSAGGGQRIPAGAT
jgi:hypothetical protein